MFINFKQFAKTNKSTILFIFLELLAIILKYNNHIFEQQPFEIAKESISYINNKLYYIQIYPFLKVENKKLLEENRLLKSKLINNNFQCYLNNQISNTKYSLLPAKVINNSFIYTKNYLILDKGKKDGIKENMGVISTNGIVGKIKYVSQNFSTVISLLHINNFVSVKLKSSNIFGSLKWDGRNSKKAEILYIPKYANITQGEEIVTSGFSNIFPENILVGKIFKVEKKVNEMFAKIYIELSTNFHSLNNVYIVENIYFDEINELKTKTEKFYE